MAKIQNIKDLRDKVLKAMEDLEDDKIDVSKASTIAKLSETVISALKSEMQYAVLTNSEPRIAFYNESTNRVLENDFTKKLR